MIHEELYAVDCETFSHISFSITLNIFSLEEELKNISTEFICDYNFTCVSNRDIFFY